jgi:hypothetical protein
MVIFLAYFWVCCEDALVWFSGTIQAKQHSRACFRKIKSRLLMVQFEVLCDLVLPTSLPWSNPTFLSVPSLGLHGPWPFLHHASLSPAPGTLCCAHSTLWMILLYHTPHFKWLLQGALVRAHYLTSLFPCTQITLASYSFSFSHLILPTVLICQLFVLPSRHSLYEDREVPLALLPIVASGTYGILDKYFMTMWINRYY